MSSENLQQTYFSSNIDCFKLLDTLFQTDQCADTIDKAFKLFKDNFKTQPTIINKLVDYYFDKRNKNDSSADNSFSENEFLYSENSRSILDLILTIPEELSNKIFDRLNEKLNTLQSSSSTNFTSSSVGYNSKIFDKTLYLLIVISYKKKNWISKNISHNILSSVIKTILRGNLMFNELLAVQTSLFFVSFLVNIVPHQNLENIFNIFLFLLKYFTNLERQNIADSISYRNVKWSVKLYFYVCYGLYGNQFIQFIKKKDHLSINKDFLMSIIFYLRLHPSILLDKNDSDKQFKNLNDDFTFEWRQYCLDPICTNFNSSMQKLLKYPLSILHNSINNFFIFNDQQFSINSQQDNFLNQSTSPSYILPSNRKSFIENETSIKRNYSVQSSIPSTPAPIFNQTFQFPVIECFQFDANQQDKKKYQQLDLNLSKNLTSHFMNEQIDSNQTLFYDDLTESNPVRLTNKKRSFSEPNLNIDFGNSDCHLRHKQVKSEMKDTNINQPCEFDLIRKKLSNQPVTTDSSTNTCDDENVFSSQNSLLKSNTSESSDIVNAYIMGLSHNASETNSGQTVARLKQEINHLVIQLMYERNLRNKYEEDSNRLHFIKIQRDQLITEKRFLEKNLKQQVEGYKNEVEECLNIQNKSEIKAYTEELEQKNEVLEALRKKLDEIENKCKDLLDENETLNKLVKIKTLECDKLIQKFENEANLKVKNEIDANYVKSLRYTVDLLRKKILVMASQKKSETLHQEDSLNQMYKDLNFPLDGQLDKYIDFTYGSIFQHTSLYQFQQKTIEIQRKEIEQLTIKNKNILAQQNEYGIELENLKSLLNLKTNEVEELKQTLLMEVVDMKGELIKSHHRIQNSLINVNKRLEEEVLKLKSNLDEQVNVNSKSLEQINQMQDNIEQLKKLKFGSFLQSGDECEKI